MKKFVEDFADWLLMRAPLWAQIVTLIMAVPLIVGLIAGVLFAALFVVALIAALLAAGYWIAAAVVPAAAIWAVLHAYGASKGGDE